MATRPLARRRAPIGGALLAALALAGCSTTAASSTTVSGPLVIYVSDPANLASDPGFQDTVDAEELACSQLKGEVTAFAVTCPAPNSPNGALLTATKLSDDARAAVEDAHAIAYLGELVPGSSSQTVGITNALDLLQVSPTDNAAALTRKSAAVSGSPSNYYEDFTTYGQTFARVVPSTSKEAAALLAEMHGLGVRTLLVQGDRSDYGLTLSSELTSGEAGQSITPASSVSAADAVLYAGSSPTEAASELDSDVAANPHLKVFVGSALASTSFLSSLSPGAQRAAYASVPGLSAPSTAAQKFATDFRSSFGHAPSPEAIFGYAAMQAVLGDLHGAGSGAGNRSTVVADFNKHTFSDNVLGPFSIDRYGDTNLSTFLIEHLKAGRLTTVKALQG